MALGVRRDRRRKLVKRKKVIMAKSLNAKKTAKKEPLKTAKEKKEEKRDKKNSPKRD